MIKLFKKAELLVLSMLLILAFTLPPETQSATRPEYLPDEILIKFKEGVSQDTIDSIVMQVGGKVVRKFRLIPAIRLKIPADTVQSAISLLQRFPEIEYAEPNY